MPPIFQTLQRMRDYEKKLAEKEKKVNSTKSETREATGTNTDRCSSSAMDQGSEASATSDVPVSSSPDVIQIFSCSTQLSMKFKLLINAEIAQIISPKSLNI